MIYHKLILLSIILGLSHVCNYSSRALGTISWLNYIGYCKLRECCHENDGTNYILYDKGVNRLREDLWAKVHGQPLILEPIYRSIMGHMNNQRPSRPLVMYFSGWTGTGKTYVAQMIARNLYSNGMHSRFVKYISSSFHFPVKIQSEHEIDLNRKRLRDMIRDTVAQCERSLIILDELDKLPAGVVDVLQPMFDYVESVDGIRYNKAIFIFLTNTGATKLNALSYKMYEEGLERNDLKSRDIEEILINESFNEPGGLRQSGLLKRYSIGVFVPFLPLERKHIKLCIGDKIKEFYTDEMNTDSIIEDISDELTYFPENVQMYSKSGCKGVQEKVINYLGPPTKPFNETESSAIKIKL